MDPARLMTQTMRSAPWGEGVARILSAALEAVDPAVAVARTLQRQGVDLVAGGKAYPLHHYRRIYVVGAGKAGAPMARAAEEILGDELYSGLVIVKEGYAPPVDEEGRVTILEAGHPVPDRRGVAATGRLAELLAETTAEDLVLCLISGGGSALLTLPEDGISLEDLQAFTGILLASGAMINELNNLRKHLDRVKGGGLARMAAPAQVLTLILSDVVGNPLDIIASGPTVSDPTTFSQAFQVLERYVIADRIPASILQFLRAGLAAKIPETPKPGDAIFNRVTNLLVGSNLLAAKAASRQARVEGYEALMLTTYLQGEARETGRVLAAIARGMAAEATPFPRPGCVIVGGETTVTLLGDGLGGRNQELALGAVEDLASCPQVALVTLATDGGDGPTDAAGAVATGETLARALEAGLAPQDFLARNDSYHFFGPLGDLLRPGPTNTNVNDLAFIFAF